MVVEMDDENEKMGAADPELEDSITNGKLLHDEESEDEEELIPNTNGVLLAKLSPAKQEKEQDCSVEIERNILERLERMNSHLLMTQNNTASAP